MANGVRTIYSPRQRMAPGQYETPFRDFLEKLPDYVNQFQRNQLVLGQQQLEKSKYDDARRQEAYRNEVTLINLLPESARAKAMIGSENKDIQEAGTAVEEESNAFDAMLNPLEVSETDSEQLDYYNNLLNNPSVRNNQARIDQVKTKIKSINNKLLRSQVKEWHNANKDNPNAKIILQQSQYDPSGAIKNITTLKDPKKREIIADASGYKRYSDTGERVFPDVVKEIPKGATIKGLTEALSSIDRELMIYRSNMTPEDVLDKERRREAIRNELENLTIGNQIGGLTIPPPGSSTAESTRARLPGMNQAPAESTKIKIPGF